MSDDNQQTIRDPDVFRCEVDEDGIEAFVACVTLGVIEAMRSGAWSLEAGIWTLGRPIFWVALERAGLSKDLLEVLQSADELDLMSKIGPPRSAEEELDRMAEVARKTLQETAPGLWRARWDGPSPSGR